MNPRIISQIPAIEDENVFVGCKKKYKVNKFYSKTAGVITVVKPCGIILGFEEMYTCESPTQAYLFVLKHFFKDERRSSNLKYLGYDRSCDLHPFLCNLAKQGNEFAKLLLDELEFLVDLFHCNKHTEVSCYPPENPQCKYHPHLPKFREIHSVNMQCAEQVFTWMSRLKNLFQKMSGWKFRFLLYVLIERRNRRIEKDLKRNSVL